MVLSKNLIKQQLTQTIMLPETVNVNIINGSTVQFLSDTSKKQIFHFNTNIKLIYENSKIIIQFDYKQLNYSYKEAKMLFKTQIALFENCLYGLQQNYKIKLNLIGVGFKFLVIDSILNLKVGYSHDIKISIPEDISVIVIKPTQLILYSLNWEKLTNFAALIKQIKPVEPYNGKGILLETEKNVFRKTSKKDKNKK